MPTSSSVDDGQPEEIAVCNLFLRQWHALYGMEVGMNMNNTTRCNDTATDTDSNDGISEMTTISEESMADQRQTVLCYA